MKRGSRFIDRTGKEYGLLTVLFFTRKNSRSQSFWMCRCSCGVEVEVFGGNLHSGHTISCGCKKGFIKHGESKVGNISPEYQALAGLIQRCKNPASRGFKDYGGRGISVCKQWDCMSKFDQFLKDVGRRPSGKYSLDRWPDKNGNYEPGNVRWATDDQQASNTRKNIYLTVNGETLHIRALSRKYGISPATLMSRLKRGIDIQTALSAKPLCRSVNKRYTK